MKLESASTPVQIVGGSTTSNFSIAANGKAFRVLSDTLYSDKIGSIVREISCNAYDAHVMAGKKDVAFEIHAPDAFEPWFSVKDFGTGLSAEAINSVFTVFFQSTKDNSNDAIGCFGLGSKTPFSYTDQFTVTSIVDGELTIYSAFISDTGMPSIIKMHSESTSEHNGVEIKMSVKREDYNRFSDAIVTQLQFFKVKPVVLNSNLKFKHREYNFDTGSIRIASGTYYSNIWIVQGNVGYPIDMNKISGKISADSQRFLESLRGNHVEFMFDIGQIGVTASREAVEYNQQTVANIEKMVQKAIAETKTFVDQKLKNMTPWEQAIFLNDNTLWYTIAKASGFKSSHFFVSSNCFFDLGMAFHTNSAVLGNQQRYADIMVRRAGNKSFSTHRRSNKTFIPSTTNEIVFIVRDVNRQIASRIDKIINDTAAMTYVQLVPIDLSDADMLYNEAVTALPGAKIIRLSEIELEKAEKTKRTKSAVGQYYSVEGVSSTTWVKEFDSIEDITDKTLYVIVRGLQIVSQHGVFGYFAAKARINDYYKMIAVPERNVEKAKKNSNLTLLDDYVKQLEDRANNNHKLRIAHKRTQLRAELNNAINTASRHDKGFLKALSSHAPNSRLAKILKLHKKVEKVKFEDQELNAFGIIPNAVSKFDSDKILKNYPLLTEYVRSHYYDIKHPEELAKYVAWIDSKA